MTTRMTVSIYLPTLLIVSAMISCPRWVIAGDVDLAITSQPYFTGGFFTNPVLPVEGDSVTLTVRATVEGELSNDPQAQLMVLSPSGETLVDKTLTLTRSKGVAEASWKWTGEKNGLYTVLTRLDPNQRIREKDETNNHAELTLPVIVKLRKLHFPWFREELSPRWATCVTSALEPEQQKRLAERGIIPLTWEFAGMSWFNSGYYDQEKLKRDPDGLLKDLEEVFYQKYATKPRGHALGYGIDETGGYPGTIHEKFSIASMKGLVRAKKEHPDRFFAVWHGGGIRKETAQYHRQAADLLILQAYVFRALPEALRNEDIYQSIKDRLDPLIRTADMLVPAYGNPCTTLLALDLSEDPTRIHLGEFEQVVRFIRRVCPEMRGLCWYVEGEGNYGGKQSPKIDLHHKRVLAQADQLCFDYFIKPCLTLMRESLWLNRTPKGKWELTAAVSNIGGVDGGEVEVKFLMNGKPIGRRSAEKTPAAFCRNFNRVFLTVPLNVQPGFHRFEARIVRAPGSTVLDAAMGLERFVD